MLFRRFLFVALVFCAACAQAVDISFVGAFPGKVVLMVDGGAPKTYAVGAKVADSITVAGVSDSTAILNVGGKRKYLSMGQHVVSKRTHGRAGKVVLSVDARGHFLTQVKINRGAVEALVDTGATKISLPAYEAKRLGIAYKDGQIGRVRTANGVTVAYQITLDKVAVGDIVLYNVDALVLEKGLHMTLLGMSFLGRTKTHREGGLMTLEKHY